MRNFEISIPSFIADNLRNRYDDGFPILKELIQNADDAQAASLRFGWHPGLAAQRAQHPLLTGPALWFWNDGRIRPGDIAAVCSFGINAKAGDAEAIGKFGLGMKSVFHLCEAFFFIAWDGSEITQECLCPWNPQIHPDWDDVMEHDWAALRHIGEDQTDRCRTSTGHWFLLWLPLRRDSHLRKPDGTPTGAILKRFPGDHADQDLAFLREPDLALRLAEIMPLLHHLTGIEAEGGHGLIAPFTVTLSAEERLDRAGGNGAARGRVHLSNGLPELGFCGRQRMAEDDWFARLKQRDEWPPTFVRNPETGEEEQKADKALPEAAVLFARASDRDQLSLRWAVFLPLSDREEFKCAIGAESHFRMTLHGQFFVDSGRKDVFDWDALFQPALDLPTDSRDEAALRRAWNAGLFQRVLAPLVLPALADFVQAEGLDDRECRALTAALADTDLYKRGRAFLSDGQAWCRCLEERAGARWQRIEGDRLHCLRPLPPPPKSDPARPWSVFPGLSAMGLLAFDAEARRLGASAVQWKEDELQRLLGEVDSLLTDGPRMEYFQAVLDEPSCAKPYLGTDWMQRRLVDLLRHAFLETDPSDWGAHRQKAQDLIALVQPERRHSVDASLPPKVWQSLLGIDTPYLLVPKGFDPQVTRSALKAGATVLLSWLSVLDRAVAGLNEAGAIEPLLGVAKGLLETQPKEERSAFLRVHPELRVLSVRDIRARCERAVSLRDLERVQADGTLFSFAGAVGGGQYGLAPLLASALPDAEVWLIQAPRYRDLVAATAPAGADAPIGILAAVARYRGPLGSLAHRRALLEEANDPTNDQQARRGLRLLLHGQPEHREDDAADLWVPRQDQHSAWAKLWQQLHGDAGWRLLDRGLAGCLRANRWPRDGIKEIAPETLIAELAAGRGIPNAAEFSIAERDEILAQITDRDLWQRLPLHTRCADDGPVSVSGPTTAYLAPATGCPDDALTRAALIIRRSDYPLQTAKQAKRDWLRPLDDRALIEIAMGAASPVQHWRAVLDAIGRLPEGDIADLTPTLRRAAWLPTRFDTPVNPEDVLDLPAALLDDAARLVAAHRAEHGPCFAVPGELAEAVHRHSAFERLRANAFSRELRGLERLALLLQDLPAQHIGNWEREPEGKTVALLAEYQALPGWRLLRDAMAAFADTSDAGAIWYKLRDGLAVPLGADSLLDVLIWLTARTNDWTPRKEATDNFLRQLAQCGERPATWLARLRLASQAGTWCTPQDLCAGAPGIDPTRVLDKRQTDILAGLVKRADRRPDGAVTSDEPGTAGFKQMREAAPQAFENAFAPWRGLVEPAMVGAIAGLLGVELRKTAEAWLNPHGYDWFKEKLRPDWHDPGRDHTGRIEWMGGRTLDDALDLIETWLVLTDGDTVELVNLLGEPIQVPLQPMERIENLVAGAPAWKGDYRVQLRLRCIDPAAQPPERLADMLRRTAEYLYYHFYNQRKPNFGALWQDLEKTRQLDIATARRMILDNVPFYLGQLAIQNGGLKALLARCDNSQQRLAELDEDRTGEGSPAWAQARKEARAALDELSRRIEHEPVLRDAVLAGVRSRIRDSQYQSASIPFELFQNADDAAVELGQIQAHPDPSGCEIPDAARRLVIEVGPERLRVLHWGRTLNDRGPPLFNGDERGFGRDLKKMLVLSASDKRPEAGVTGRLGLGFKSVLLACDRPRIASGRLAVEIVGGLLPTPWSTCAEARDCLRRHSADHPTLLGTLIELTPMDGTAQRQVLERFERLAGVLCVFARAIRRIDLYGSADAAGPDRRRHWAPMRLDDGLELGTLDLASKDWGDTTKALCLRTKHGSLLCALGPKGFRPMPDDVPAVWVTAPTAESAALGFAINGPFGLDPGRARLAADNAENLERARTVGRGAGDVLASLLAASAENWPGLREGLQLAADLSAHDFWRDLWLGLTGTWLGRQRDAAGELARAAIVALIETLADRPEAIPNGLPLPHGAMVSRRDVRFELATVFATAPVVDVLHGWPRFTARFAPSGTVTEAIGAILKHTQLVSLATVGPSALLKLCSNREAEPTDAAALGTILRETEDAIDWNKGDLRELLGGLRFRAQDGTWTEARRLLTDSRPGSDSETAEERRRFAIAPPSRRLHAAYTAELDGAAIEFFTACRERIEAPARDLAQWILAAGTNALCIAALQLLARGDNRSEVAALVRGRDWLASVLSRQDLLQEAQLTSADRAELRRLLARDDSIDRAIESEADTTDDVPIGWRIDLPTGLQRIYDWWAKERIHRAQTYRDRLYPWNIDMTEDAETGRFDRSSWLTLFALGAFQSLPWRNDDRNRAFLRLCRDRDWWQTFAEIDPREQPDQWMNIIEDYAQGQHNDQEWFLWIAQFPNLYRLARWLDDYIGLFRSIQEFSKPFGVNTILASRAADVYQGGSYDAPPINRTMNVGVHLVIRELLHHGVLNNVHAVPHAYALTDPIRRLFAGFGETLESTGEIHKLLVTHLGPERARFHNDYDIPLRLVAGDVAQQAELFG